MRTRHAWFALLSAASGLLFRGQLGALTALSLHDERYTHIAVIPVFTGILLFLERRRIFARSEYRLLAGTAVMLVGATALYMAGRRPLSLDTLWFSGLCLSVFWVGAFIACYGFSSFMAGRFPMLFLFWIIPIPPAMLDKVVTALRAGSADLSYLLFRMLRLPVLKHGFILSLPGVDIDVAPECSGIRSGISLFISGLVAAHLLLRSRWKRACLLACVALVVVLKNAIRIVTISLLGLYVDRGFLSGNLHHYGGLPFSFVGLGLLLPIIWLLWRSEIEQWKVRAD